MAKRAHAVQVSCAYVQGWAISHSIICVLMAVITKFGRPKPPTVPHSFMSCVRDLLQARAGRPAQENSLDLRSHSAARRKFSGSSLVARTLSPAFLVSSWRRGEQWKLCAFVQMTALEWKWVMGLKNCPSGTNTFIWIELKWIELNWKTPGCYSSTLESTSTFIRWSN